MLIISILYTFDFEYMDCYCIRFRGVGLSWGRAKTPPPVRREAFQTTHDLVFRRSGSPWGAFQSRIPIKNESIPHGVFFSIFLSKTCFFSSGLLWGVKRARYSGWLVWNVWVGGEKFAEHPASRRGPPDYSESNLKQLFTTPKQVSNNPKQVLNNFFPTPRQV